MNHLHKLGGGDLIVEEDARITGFVGGDIVVRPRVRADLRCVVGGDVRLGEKSEADIHGVVRGDLEVGWIARARVYGVVNGRIVDETGGYAQLGGSCSSTAPTIS